jgi:hypothetical protein
MYNTVGGLTGTTAYQNTLTLTRTGDLSLMGGITATTGYFNGGTTIVGTLSTNTIQSFSGNTFNLATNGPAINIGTTGSTFGIVANQFLSAGNGLFVGGNYGIQIAGTSGLFTPGPTGAGAAFGYNTREPGGANLELAVGRGGVTAGGGLNIFNTSVTGNTGISKIFALDNTGTLTLAGPLKSSIVSSSIAAPTYAWRYQYVTDAPTSFANFTSLTFYDAWATPSSNNTANYYTAPITGIYSVSAYVRGADDTNSFACFFSEPIPTPDGFSGSPKSYSAQGSTGTNQNAPVASSANTISVQTDYTAVWTAVDSPREDLLYRRTATLHQYIKLNAGEKITVSVYSPVSTAWCSALFCGHLVCAL